MEELFDIRKLVEEFAENTELPLLFIDGHDNAILGVSRKFNYYSVIYDKKKVISNLLEHMDYESAIEYFEFNIVGAWLGDNTPTFLEDLMEN